MSQYKMADFANYLRGSTDKQGISAAWPDDDPCLPGARPNRGEKDPNVSKRVFKR
jgi:hypothetical protein